MAGTRTVERRSFGSVGARSITAPAVVAALLLTACATLIGLDGEYAKGGDDDAGGVPDGGPAVDGESTADGPASDAGDADAFVPSLCEAGAADGGGCREDIVDLAVGYRHGCVLRRSGELHCIGGNYDGQLGVSTSASANPAFVTVVAIGDGGAPASFTHVSAAGVQTCAVATSGDAYCWGRNELGQLGNPGVVALGSESPVRVALPARALSVATGGWHACAIVDVAAPASNVYCWGSGTYGGLGNGTTTNVSAPVAVTPSIRATRLISGDGLGDSALTVTCAETTSGVSKCWGVANSDALGIGAPSCGGNACFTSPRDWEDPAAKQVSYGYLATCGLRGDGGVACKGYNRDGLIGPTCPIYETATLVAKPMPAGVVPVDLAFRATHACIRTAAGAVWCWGSNVQGQLGAGGDGGGTPTGECGVGRVAPNRVVKADGMPLVATKIAVGHEVSLALGADGRVWGWGNSSFGLLGFSQPPVDGGCACRGFAGLLPELPPTKAP